MFFLKKQKKDFNKAKNQILKRIDYLLDISHKRNYNKRNEIEDLRKTIIQYNFNQEETIEIINMFDNFESSIVTNEYFDYFIKEMHSKMIKLFKRKQKTEKKSVEEQNQELIDQLVHEITSAQYRIKDLVSKINISLASKNEVEWRILNSEKKTLENKIQLKINALKSLIAKNENLLLVNEANKIKEINNRLSSDNNVVDISTFEKTVIDSKVISEDILAEQSNIQNIINNNNSIDNDFNKAYEQFLLDNCFSANKDAVKKESN